MYGKTIAIDADRGSVLWEYTAPQVRPGRARARSSTAPRWPIPIAITSMPPRPTARFRSWRWQTGMCSGRRPSPNYLRRARRLPRPCVNSAASIIAVTTGYIGDAPPYQGHVAILDAQSGRLVHVWNSLCSDQPRLLIPSACPSAQSWIWGRAGAVIDSTTGDIFVATGNWHLQRQDRLGGFDHRARQRCAADARQLHDRQQHRARRAGSRHRLDLTGTAGRRSRGARGQGQAHPIARPSGHRRHGPAPEP